MNDIAIKAEGLGKLYQIGKRENYRTFREVLSRRFTGLFQKSQNPELQNSIWALKDVSFDIKKGEVVGIIGRNGAGKSTLLKILSRITEPTEGSAEIHGRVASLLEVGTGFHSELTGRENIYLNAAILGMKKREIDKKFDEIVAFAEVEKFVETPVKHYSSGMYMRLAFAVAAHLQPDILLIDEVLAVGDAAFQKKCLGKMDAVAKEGKTVLFVSHNLQAIERLCGRSMLLHMGMVKEMGETHKVVLDYLKNIDTNIAEQQWTDPAIAPGNEYVRLQRVRIIPEKSEAHITVETPFQIEFEYLNLIKDTRLNLSLVIYNAEGVCVFSSTTVKEPSWHDRPFPKGVFRSVCNVPGNFLNDGTYRIKIIFVKDTSVILYSHEEVLAFNVQDVPRLGFWYGKWIGVVRPDLQWQTCLLTQDIEKA